MHRARVALVVQVRYEVAANLIGEVGFDALTVRRSRKTPEPWKHSGDRAAKADRKANKPTTVKASPKAAPKKAATFEKKVAA